MILYRKKKMKKIHRNLLAIWLQHFLMQNNHKMCLKTIFFFINLQQKSARNPACLYSGK